MFVREEELQRLLDWVEPLWEKGQGKVVFIRGEEGMGKTRLTEAFLEKLGETNYHFTCLRAQEGQENKPYSFLIEILLAVLREDQKKRKGEKDLGALLARLFPKKHQELSPLLALLGVAEEESLLSQLPPAERAGLIRTLSLELLERVALQKPWVLILENIERIDSATLDILEEFVEWGSGEDFPFFLVLTSKTPQPFPYDILHNLTLRPLKEEKIKAILSLHASDKETEALEELSQWMLKRTGGNPFFIEQLFLLLQRLDLLEEKEGSYFLSDKNHFFPGTLQAAIMERIDHLEKEKRTFLRNISVLGAKFTPELLEAFLDESNMDSMVQSLEEQLFLEKREDKVEFLHPLIREVAYNTILRSQRTELHLKSALTLEEYGEDLPENKRNEEILNHYLETEEREKKIEYLEKVAHQKDKSSLFEEASYLYHLLLEELPDGTEKWKEVKKKVIRVLIRQGETNINIGHVAEILDYAEEKERPWIYMILSKLHQQKEDYNAGLQYARQVLQCPQVDEREIEIRTKILLGSNLRHLGDLEGGEEYLVQALEEAEEEDLFKGEILFHLGEVFRLKNSCETAISCLLQGAEYFEDQDRLPRYYETLSKLGLLYLKTENWKEARSVFRAVIDFYKKLQISSKLGEAYYYLALTLKREGNRDFARTLFREAMELLEEGEEPYLLGMSHFHLAEIEMGRGKKAPAERLILQAIRLFDESNNIAALEQAQSLLAKIS